MSEFINTADIMGDQETLDALVAHTLTDLKEDRVTSLAQYALQHNDGLETVELPNLTSANQYAFSHCENLTSVSMPSCTSLPNYLFEYCYSLQSFDFTNVSSLGTYCFRHCHSLKSIQLANVATIPNYCFAYTRSLSSVSAASATRLNQYCFQETGAATLAFPNVTTLGANMINGARTSVFDLSKQCSIVANAFNAAANLTALILRSSTMCSLANISGLAGTPIRNGKGYVYVPSDLVATYQTATNWSTVASQIVSIDDYPIAPVADTITDSWSEIVTKINSGTATYSIGDTKNIWGTDGAFYTAELVALGADSLASGSGTASTTWIIKSLCCTHHMNSTNTNAGGWADSEMRTWLQDTILPTLPSELQAAIKPVTKTYRTYESGTLSTTDSIWLPSYREIFGGTSYEDSGAIYSGVFSSAANRIKYDAAGTASYWWLRSAYTSSATNFAYVYNNGSGSGNSNASGSYGVVFGFCI